MVKEIKIINKLQKKVRDIQYKRLHKKTLRDSFIPHTVAIERSKLSKYKPLRNIKNGFIGGSFVGIGITSICVGAITWFIPFTTLPLIWAGSNIILFGLLVASCSINIRYLIRELIKDFKFKLGFLLQ